MSVTTAQFTDRNSSPNAIKICKKEESSDYTHCIDLLYCEDEGRLTNYAYLCKSCCTYPSTYKLNISVYAYKH